jgi:Ser/Thr protein kinase RdoA (MazF antagonist)
MDSMSLVEKACSRFGITLADYHLKPLESRDETYLIEDRKDAIHGFVIKIRDRPEKSVIAETDWVQFLEGHNIPVHKQVLSVNSKFVETVEGRTVTVTKKANGGITIGPLEKFWNPAMFRRLGEVCPATRSSSNLLCRSVERCIS